MPKRERAKSAKPAKAKAAAAGRAAIAESKNVTIPKIKKGAKTSLAGTAEETARVIRSETAYRGPLFRVVRDRIVEPGGKQGVRDIIRHNGSVVILAVDSAKSRKNPWIVMERQYRHAAKQYLWELPAGTLDPGEEPLAGARRELAEETGYNARKWRPLVEYYASPGFLSESMKVFLAEGLVAGEARPEDDEQIELRLVKLSDLLKMIESGAILDSKTLISVLFYHRLTKGKRKK